MSQHAIILNNDLVRRAIKEMKLPPAKDGLLHIFGVRGALPVWEGGVCHLIRTANRPNEYDDTIGVFGAEIQAYRGSVDPGRYWVTHPMNPEGAAFLCKGLWKYRMGLHRGRAALVQHDDVEIIRDRDRDGTPEPGEKRERGFFGINIHAGGDGPEVERWSAGCQVIQGGWEGLPWRRFINTCYAALERPSPAQITFSYYLMDWADIAKVAR